jgi:uncharacterized protein YndB with AHSA1/START domain
MRTTEGEVHAIVGEYKEISRPNRLVYTWAWESSDDAEMATETIVTVEFSGDGDGTAVELTHTGFPSEGNRDQHAHGWEGCFANLERMFAGDK